MNYKTNSDSISKLDAFVVGEQLSGRNIERNTKEGTNFEWYKLNYPELRNKKMFTNIFMYPKMIILTAPEYKNTKIEHIINTHISRFNARVNVEEKTQSAPLRGGQTFDRPLYIIRLHFSNTEDVVDCWNYIFKLLMEEDYLEKSVRRLHEEVLKLIDKGKNW